MTSASSANCSEGGDRIARVRSRIAQQEQTAFLGAEDEHQSHHHRQRGLIQLGGLDVAEEFSIAVLVGLVEALNSTSTARRTCSPRVR